MQSLGAYCDNHRDWSNHVPETAFVHTSESVVTSYTPALFGRELRTFWDPVKVKSDTEPTTIGHVFAAEVAQCLKDVLGFARGHQGAARTAQNRHYDAHRRPTIFVVGDLVLLDVHTLNGASKGIIVNLARRRTGPFRATHQIGRNDHAFCKAATDRYCGVSACGPTVTISRALVRAETYKFMLEGGEICEQKRAGVYQV